MAYYLDFLGEYEIIDKSSKRGYIAIPFTADTETSHTPLNTGEEAESIDPILKEKGKVFAYLQSVKIIIPWHVKMNTEWHEISFLFNKCRIKWGREGSTIEEVYDYIRYIGLPNLINDIDMIEYIYQWLLDYLHEIPQKIDVNQLEGVKAWVYQWAFCFKAGKNFSMTYAGRTARDLVILFKGISDKCDNLAMIRTKVKLLKHYKGNLDKGKYNVNNPSKSALEKCAYKVTAVIYYMNLGYDYEYLFQFIREYFDEGEEFFMDAHHPLFVRFGNIELRDAYLYFNEGLEKVTNKYRVDHPKAVGLVDYDKIVFPDDPLTKEDWIYQYFDVLGLQEAILKDYEVYGYNVITCPYTNTGRVRNALRSIYLQDEENRRNFIHTYTDGLTQQLLRMAFQGGYTHGNRAYKNMIIDDNTEIV